MKLTPEILRAAYGYLLETEPFNEWNLPDAEDVVFKLLRTDRVHGRCKSLILADGTCSFTIYISAVTHTHTQALMQTMAHEMVHVHQRHNCINRGERAHGADFRALRAEVCAAHGFDPGQF